MIKRYIIIFSFLGLPLAGCATNPKSLDIPENLTCIQVPPGVEMVDTRGVLKVKWHTRLQAGPYISELYDSKGTYYRAPPGGILYGREGGAGSASDGGIWVPHNPRLAPRFYSYFSTQSAEVIIPKQGENCDSAIYSGDPDAKGVSSVKFATVGALTGATAGISARATSKNTSLSYGQAAGAGAVGGAIGGAIVAGLINMDVGKINIGGLLKDPVLIELLRNISLNATPVKPSKN